MSENGRLQLNHCPSQVQATERGSKIIKHRFDDLVAEANPIRSAQTQRYAQLAN